MIVSINVTLDGCVDPRAGIANDKTHAYLICLVDEGGAMPRATASTR